MKIERPTKFLEITEISKNSIDVDIYNTRRDDKGEIITTQHSGGINLQRQHVKQLIKGLRNMVKEESRLPTLVKDVLITEHHNKVLAYINNNPGCTEREITEAMNLDAMIIDKIMEDLETVEFIVGEMTFTGKER